MDEHFMLEAIKLAKNGGDKVAPNPKVGAVIVKAGKVIGSGYHEFFGGPHAEVNAIKSLKESAEGATIYVTLEPCSHYGKTPPCVNAIIKEGFKKVVVGTIDPNPLVKGRGIEILKKHNIDVIVGILERECSALNEEYNKNIGK